MKKYFNKRAAAYFLGIFIVCSPMLFLYIAPTIAPIVLYLKGETKDQDKEPKSALPPLSKDRPVTNVLAG